MVNDAKFILLFWILTRVYCVGLEYRTFRCKNGTYISGELICDGKKDCIDDDVEENDLYCDRKHCGPGKFRCRTYSNLRSFSTEFSYSDEPICKFATTHCDTVDDCSSFSNGFVADEVNCGDEVKIDNCLMEKGKYLCMDRKKCIDFKYACDGFCNCFDCSDERDGCLNDGYWGDDLSKDHNTCFKTPNGPVCCSKFNSLCQKCDSLSEELCDQICIEFACQPRCLCGKNYVAVPNTNNSECTLKNNMLKENLLLYSIEGHIKAVDLFTNANFLVKNLTERCTALAAAHEYIYYATDSGDESPMNKRVLKMSRISKDVYEIFKSDEIITSMAVDWITNNVYYTTSSSLFVCTNNGVYCKLLKYDDEIRSVNLAPKLGLMFWISYKDTDHDYYLKKSSMDGLDEKIVINFDNPRSLQVLSVDELTERIYFYSASSQEIDSITFDGNKRRFWRSDLKIYKGVVFEGHFFFIDSNQVAIFSAEKKSGMITQRVSLPKRPWNSYDYNLLQLHVYNSLLQDTEISNQCQNWCPLCLLCPSSSMGLLNFTCIQSGFTYTSTTVTFIRLVVAFFILSLPIIAILTCALSYKNFHKRDTSKQDTSTTVRKISYLPVSEPQPGPSTSKI